MALVELLRKAEPDPGVDVWRDGVRVLAAALMDLEVSQHLGAEHHERTSPGSSPTPTPRSGWSEHRALSSTTNGRLGGGTSVPSHRPPGR